MRILFLLFAATLSSFGFSCTTTGSGVWSHTETWGACGGGVPHSGDTASIGNGHTITSASNVTVGGLTLVGTGTMTVTGGTFQVNGTITFDPKDYYCSVYNPVVTLYAGTTLKFDSIGPSSGAACRPLVANGTPDAHVTIAARNSTASARLGGSIAWTYADFSNIITFSVDEDYTSGLLRFKWDVTHSTFTNVGAITMMSCCGLSGGGYFRHAWNVHKSSADSTIFANWYDNSGASLGNGARDIVGNIFDKQFCSWFSPAYFTIVGNYFGDSPIWGGSLPAPNNVWSRFDGNFVRIATPWPSRNGDMLNSLFLIDLSINNPHVLEPFNGAGGTALIGAVVDHAGDAGTTDSGELWNAGTPISVSTFSVLNTLMLCNMYGTSSYEVAAWGIFPNGRGIMEHSTWCGGYVGNAATIGFPAYQMGEGYTPLAGQLLSLRSNIFWNPHASGTVVPWSKMAEIGAKASPTQDICAPANCDYNTGFGLGYHATEPTWTAYTGQGKGYVAKFSAPPGVHDVDVDPKFVDYKRSVPLFYTKYLGNTPAEWSVATSYAAGNIVTYTDPAIYYGLPVAYRYQNIGSCASQNPTPGSGPNWRDCWEWATLKWLRDNVATNTLFDDPSIGVSHQDAIAVVWAWIRAGYSPTNPVLARAAHDAGDIGPMPVTFEIPGNGVETSAGTGTIRGARIRGSVIK